MNMSLGRAGLIAGSVLIAGGALVADGTRFSDFTPLTSSAGPTANEAMPITFGNPAFVQESIADRSTQLLLSKPNSGDWDMITVNETGPQKGGYLFAVFETDSSGVQRMNVATRETETIWQTPTTGGHVSFDACYWTPWGTLITAEESWATAPAGSTSPYGRLFELRNPLDAPGIFNPVSAASNNGADFVHRNVIPRVSHEGIQFDSALNMYFVDELNGGSLYKYTPKANWGESIAGTAEYFSAGQTFVLRVGNGSTPNATGAYTWVPITDSDGVGLPGTITITDIRGVTSVDARNTIDLATGSAVGSAFAGPDNLAVDHDGNIYVIEDRNGGTDDDIWFAVDSNKDGDLKDPGEGLARWASNGTPGSEFTGLYFDPMNKRRAWVNIQHPTSGNDRTIEITIP